jgi:hypothetical protein
LNFNLKGKFEKEIKKAGQTALLPKKSDKLLAVKLDLTERVLSFP